MRFINYKKINIFKQILEQFTDENKFMFFGVFKSFISGRYKWIASFLFKSRNNIQANKHKCYTSFYSDVEMNLNQFGNVSDIQNYITVDGIARAKIAKFSYELSSKQYKNLGQEHTEFNQIDFINASGQFNLDPFRVGDNNLDVFHKHGDSPAFVVAGYKLKKYDNEYGGVFPIYTYENQPEVNIKYNSLEIILNDDAKDLYSNSTFKAYISGISTSSEGLLGGGINNGL